MATSGSYNFSQACNALITDALQLIGVYGIGRTVSSEDMTLGRNALNKMVKAWATQGLHLWAKSEGVLYLDQYVAKYSLGNASGDAKVTAVSDEVITQLNGALATSATSATVDSTTGMTVGDYIGVVMSDNDTHWTTIATLPTSTTLTLTTGVSGACSDNAIVYTFTSKIYKPLRVTGARLVRGIDSGATSSKVENIINLVSYQTYFEMPMKTANGVPNQLHYNPNIDNGTVWVWPRPSDTNYRVEFSYERQIQDLDTATDDFDFPSEWLEPLTWQLAVRLAPFFDREKKLNTIMPIAVAMLDGLKNWDSENTGIQIIPDIEEW